MILPDFYTSLKEGNKNWHFSFVRLIWVEISIFSWHIAPFPKTLPPIRSENEGVSGKKGDL